MAWTGGLAQWEDGDTLFLSIAFTWLLDTAHGLAMFAKACGRRVVAGGPALFLVKMRHELADVAEIRDSYPDAIARHNPDATFASRGCPVGCYFCIVPAMEGREFTLIPDFPVRPILCDNNLSALPVDYQDHIIAKYAAAGVKMIDANSGFEPMTFDVDTYRRWRPLVNAGGGPWRFAFDEQREREQAHRMMAILAGEPQRRKRVYVLIGNECFDDCMSRIHAVIAAGCEPHVQPYMKLNALVKDPHVRFDWTTQRLRDVARWANRRGWKYCKFSEYDRHYRRGRAAPEVYDGQQGLFV